LGRISKKDINKAITDYRRLNDYEKLVLLCGTFNPFSKKLTTAIFDLIDTIEGEVAQKITRPKKLAAFLVANYPKYYYEKKRGMLFVVGKMTEAEKQSLLLYYRKRADKTIIENLFAQSQIASKERTSAKKQAISKLRKMLVVCEIGSFEYFIEFVKYIRGHNHSIPWRDIIPLRPFNLIADPNKFIVEINGFAKREDFTTLFQLFHEFKKRKDLSIRGRENYQFEKQVIAYHKRIISEMKNQKLTMSLENYNCILLPKHGVFSDPAMIRRARKRIGAMVDALAYTLTPHK